MTLFRVPFIMIFDLIMAQPTRKELFTVRASTLASPPIVLATKLIVLFFLFKRGVDLKVEVVLLNIITCILFVFLFLLHFVDQIMYFYI